MVRVALGGISHETNTFSTAALGLTELTHFQTYRGEDLLHYATHGLKMYTAGMFDAAQKLKYECVPLLLADTEPSGTISDSAFEQLHDELCDRLRSSLPVDAVALEVHGAGVAESYADIEGALARSVREIVGPGVPIVGAFDLHGNISQECAHLFDFICCVHEYPHTDAFERGVEAMCMVPRLLSGMKTAVHLEQLPLMLPLSMMCTNEGFPANDMNRFMYELERVPGVIDCTVFHGFPLADVPNACASVIVTTEGDPVLAKQVGREAGAWIWHNRERFRLEIETDGHHEANVHSPSSAIKAALCCLETSELDGPVLVNEASDNTGCGASGDATHLLRAMVEAGFDRGQACFGWIYDPEVLAQAQRVTVGECIHVSLGGKIDPALCGPPVEAVANVSMLTDGCFQSTPGAAYPGERKYGPMALLDIENVQVLIAGIREQVYDYGAFELAGIDVRRCNVVGIKSATHFRAGWEQIASKIITCEGLGWSSNKFEVFEPFRKHKIRRWPICTALSYTSSMGGMAKL